MAELDYRFCSAHPLHDTEFHLNALLEAAESPVHQELSGKLERVIMALSSQIGKLLLPSLPQWVVHGDPKFSNLLFEKERAVALIDLDTCNRDSILVDLGDAIRSWCTESSGDLHSELNLEHFRALLVGYREEGPKLSKEELRHLTDAGLLITLELTVRFLTDAMEESYFAWDPQRYPDSRSHNLARAEGMLQLSRSIKAQRWEMQNLVRSEICSA